MFWLVYVFSAVAVVIGWLALRYVLRPKTDIDKLPMPSGKHWLFGHVALLDKTPTYMPIWAREFGSVFALQFGPIKFVFVTEPAILRKIFLQSSQRLPPNPNNLFTSTSLFDLNPEDIWRPSRRRMNPFFSNPKTSAMLPCILNATRQLILKLHKSNGNYVNISTAMSCVIMDILMQALFSQPFDPEDQESVGLLKAMETVNETYLLGNQLSSIPYIGKFIPHPHISRLKKASAYVREYARKATTKRRDMLRKGEKIPADLLSDLIQSVDTPLDQPLPVDVEKNILDELMFLFFAGHETTSNSLQFTLLELCRHPEICDRVVDEVMSVIKSPVPQETDGLKADVFLNELPYADKVLKEILRLYPIANMTFRVIHEPLQINQYTLPKNTVVAISFPALHRLPQHWEKPNEFFPEHFDKEAVEQRDSSAYLPFGGGMRACIGMRMAQLEQRVVLAYIARNFIFELAPNQDICAISGLSIHPNIPIMMRFIPRTHST